MKKFLTYLILISFCFLSFETNTALAAESWPSFPSVSLQSESTIVMDTSTGTVLIGKNQNEKHYPASITKILTTLVALENDPTMSKTVTISKEAYSINNMQGGAALSGAKTGTKLSMKDALYAVMLGSANEVSYSVGEAIAGSNDKFAQMMNAKAKLLGCKNSHFVNSNGFHDDDHYTTAYDMALIGSAAIKNKTFQTITNTASYTVSGYETIVPHHKMVTDSSTYPYCIGGKTGQTSSAGNTLVTFTKKDGMTLVCVLMKQPKQPTHEFIATNKLINYCYTNFTSFNLEKNDFEKINKALDDTLDSFKPNFSKDASVFLYLDNNASVILPKGVDFSKATMSLNINKNAIIENGINVVGTITYTYGKKTVSTNNIYMQYYESNVNISSSSVDNNSFNLLLQNTSQAGSISSIKSIIIDTLLIGFILCIILVIILFIKDYLIKKRKNNNNSYPY